MQPASKTQPPYSGWADMRFDVQSATLSLRNLQTQLDRTRMRTNDGVRLDEQSALAELESATAARARAQADYARAAIRAPISGRVRACRPAD